MEVAKYAAPTIIYEYINGNDCGIKCPRGSLPSCNPDGTLKATQCIAVGSDDSSDSWW